MEMADWLVCLHDRVAQDIPAEFGCKLTVAPQSAMPLTSQRRPALRHFDICVIGHLRLMRSRLIRVNSKLWIGAQITRSELRITCALHGRLTLDERHVVELQTRPTKLTNGFSGLIFSPGVCTCRFIGSRGTRIRTRATIGIDELRNACPEIADFLAECIALVFFPIRIDVVIVSRPIPHDP